MLSSISSILLSYSIASAQTPAPPPLDPPNMSTWTAISSEGLSPQLECGPTVNLLIRQTFENPETKQRGLQLFTYSCFPKTFAILEAWETTTGAKTALRIDDGSWKVGDGGYRMQFFCDTNPIDPSEQRFAGVKLTIMVNRKPFTQTYWATGMKH